MVKFVAGFLAGIVTVFILVFSMGNNAVYEDRMAVSATPVPVVKKQQQRQQTAPAVQYTAPAVQNTAPAVQNTAPAVQNTAPAMQNTVPTVQNTVPTVQNTAPAVQNTAPAAVIKTNNDASLRAEAMTYIPAAYGVGTAVTLSTIAVFPPSIASNQPVSTPVPIVTVSHLPSAALTAESRDYLAAVFSLLVESDLAFEVLKQQLEGAVKDGAVTHSDGWKLRTTEAIASIQDANQRLRALVVPERFVDVSMELIMMASYLDAAMDQLSADIGDVSVNYSDAKKDEHTNSLVAADEARQRALEKIRTMQVAE